MPRRTPEPLQQYRGTTAQHVAYTGPVGEITVDTTKKTAVVHDGVTAGGHPLAKESTTITASNGVEISAGGTLGQNTTVSGVSASTSAPGVVQLNNATDSTAQNQAATPKAVSDALQAAKDYADTAVGAGYTGAAPISVDANTREISVADATASTKGVVSVGTNLNVTNGAVSVATASTTAKGVMQVGDNMTVNGGVVSVKPWTDYAVDHTTVDPTTLQEDAIVVTDESIGYPTAVLAEIEQTLSGSASVVPSSFAVRPEVMAHAAMPSGKYVTYTIGASGSIITAYDDGYIAFGATGAGSIQLGTGIDSDSAPRLQYAYTNSNVGIGVVLAVKKNERVMYSYTPGVSFSSYGFLRFIYANGNAPSA